MKKYTAKEVYEMCEKELEEMRSAGVPQLQLNYIQLGFLSLYGSLVLESISKGDNESTSV